MTSPGEDQSLAGHVETRLAAARARLISRAVVFDEVSSTQDVARAMDPVGGGVMVIARRQTAGRGRLGRAWADPAEKGLAATFAIAAPSLSSAHLSLAAGVAVVRACAAVLGREPSTCGLGLRWPNDVVECASPGRKVAGVLIERHGEAALVGVGINVHQQTRDWPPELQARAVSLSQHSPQRVDLRDIAAELALALEHALHAAPGDLVEAWGRFDVLRGTRRSFVHNGHVYAGIIQGIEPESHIALREDSGRIVLLPALTTSLVHDA